MAKLNLNALKNVKRRVFTQNAVLGLAATLLILILDWGGDDGVLTVFERPLYDERAKKFQYFRPPPTDRLMHIDITDSSLQHIGAWPWPRSKIAMMLREIHRAGAKAVAFDVIFAEAQTERFNPARHQAKSKKDADVVQGTFHRVIDDLEFAKAVGDFGKVILPASFHVREPESPAQSVARQTLKRDIFLSEDAVLKELRRRNVDIPPSYQFLALYQDARRKALYESITLSIERHYVALKNAERTEAASAGAAKTSGTETNKDAPLNNVAAPDRETTPVPADNIQPQSVPPLLPDTKPKAKSLELRVRDDVLPGIETKYDHAHLGELFEKEYSKAISFYHLRRFSRPTKERYKATPVIGALAPIPTLVQFQGAFGFIDNHLTDSDGKVRKLALFEDYNGRLYPNMSVALACAMLDVDIRDIEINDDNVVIPIPDGRRVVIPVFSHHVETAGRECGLFTYFPWFGTPNVSDAWMNMYDKSGGDAGDAHLPILKIWEVVELQNDKVVNNTESIRETLFSIFDNFDPTVLDRLLASPIPLENADGYLSLLDAPWIKGPLENDIPGLIGDAHKMNDAEFAELLKEVPNENERIIITRIRAGLQKLPDLREQLTHIHNELVRLRANLKSKLNGKAILVGWTAEGRMDDIPTSLHPSVPGVVAHGVMFNAILTGEVWQKATPWIARFFTLFMGLTITLAVAKMTPAKALLSAVVLAGSYVLFNCIILFDLNNLVVGMAAPLLAVIVVWASGTMLRFIVERREKAFITRRFRSYVDPALVNFVMENPDRASFAGEVREMSVVFTDLQGFTTISEKLQEATVPLLNEYMERMVPIIREREGYVNKFLGDGIMFFYGAPQTSATHAVDSVATALRMQEAMVPFNEKLAADDLPTVAMRVGISTGSMVVGDAGSHDAADYTVLGDSVNFAARLESANKYTGTRVMMSERTADLLGDEFLLRPVARLQVVGKTHGMVAYEPLNFMNAATDEQKKLAKLSTQMFDQYKARQFDLCIETLAVLDEIEGPGKLTTLYREHCVEYLVTPPDDDFDGTIVLTSK